MEIDKKLIYDGYISERRHTKYPYFIYNYTQKTQYDGEWNKHTMMCRGLILDDKGKVIARPFKKFFNMGEYNQHNHLGTLPHYTYFDVFNKLDGSLGILYQTPDGDFAIATRGSFDSEQAKVGTEILKEKYAHVPFNSNLTYLFEIIYPENRIVVDYGQQKDLMLLAVINKEDGTEFGYEELLNFSDKSKIPMTQYCGRTAYNRHIFSKLYTKIPEGAEGFVLLFDNGLRVKIKSDEYLRLHRLITGVSNKSIWELLRNGQGTDELLDRVPDEFYNYVKQTTTMFFGSYDEINNYCRNVLVKLPWLNADQSNMREIAEIIKAHKYSGVTFAMFRKKEYNDAIWKLLRPVYAKPFAKENEEDL